MADEHEPLAGGLRQAGESEERQGQCRGDERSAQKARCHGAYLPMLWPEAPRPWLRQHFLPDVRPLE